MTSNQAVKSYTLHELEYKRMAENGVTAWDARPWAKSDVGPEDIDQDTLRVLNMMFEKRWMPQKGLALEIGCGTGPVVRWLGRKGFRGHGVDVSATAIDMARKLSVNQPSLEYFHEDFCMGEQRRAHYDVVLDGHCFHCLTNAEDRFAFIERSKALLAPSGVFVLMAMCGPVFNPESGFGQQRLIDHLLFTPVTDGSGIDGCITSDGCEYVPIRYVADWTAILDELIPHKFLIKQIIYEAATEESRFGSLSVACAVERV